MISRAQVDEAHRDALSHRFRLREFLMVDEAKATPADMELIQELRAASTPEAFDAVIHKLAVNALFRRGVLYIGRTR